MEEDRLSDEETLLHFKRKKFIKLSPFTTTNYTLKREIPKKTRRIGVINSILHTQSTIPNRKKRSDRNRNRYASDIIHDQQHLEEQEVAMCLIMLSTHNNNNNNMLHSNSSPHNNSQDPDRNTTKVAILKDVKNKNTPFECTTCNQMFHSYQALGGHRASHNKTNNLLLPSPVPDTTQPKRRNKKMRDNNHHECPICFKVFQSGQALGGHKRSHLLASQANNNNPSSQPSVVVNPVPEITRSFLDLNLPAPIEDEGEESCSTTTVGTLNLHQPWWDVGPNLKHETVIAN